jgi:hypothetical protein
LNYATIVENYLFFAISEYAATLVQLLRKKITKKHRARTLRRKYSPDYTMSTRYR